MTLLFPPSNPSETSTLKTKQVLSAITTMTGKEEYSFPIHLSLLVMTWQRSSKKKNTSTHTPTPAAVIKMLHGMSYYPWISIGERRRHKQTTGLVNK